ncbi:hypothetical protein [Roseofilum capinflatum]|uniref:Uncharacterized protein n=1 Tax=Roseofilum capinflatum BLCC-M114 TaxID=3022440 RepID=A0ABT7B283_9CYAN|nr:hypothetical protein [Roseofilum capinflatum]MDJ1173231.1 hypothetical protein [Roseofilum capinflatum BLCC-M114]
MPLPWVIAATGTFVAITASRIISIVAGRKFAEKSASKRRSVSAQKSEKVSQAESEYFKRKNQREEELANIEADLANMRETEILANIEIAKAEADREERFLGISNKNLQLRKQELALLKARLKEDIKHSEAQREQMECSLKLRQREVELMEEDIRERQKLSYLYLDAQRTHNANQVILKLTELQSNWDRENWAGIISREEMKRLLVESQSKHRLLIMISPPDIADSLEFNTHLQKQVRSEVKEFLEQNYPLHEDLCPVEYYGKFFKSSIFDAEVKQLESDLEPIPTLVIYSDVTDEKVYFHVYFWGLEETLPLTFPWNWQEEYQKLIAQGVSQENSLMAIRQSIVTIHQLIAAFLADLYYLSINPLHQPRLFEMDTDLPIEWIESNFGILREVQQQKLKEYEEEQKLIEQENQIIKRFAY